jgi:hypothetical protein
MLGPSICVAVTATRRRGDDRRGSPTLGGCDGDGRILTDYMVKRFLQRITQIAEIYRSAGTAPPPGRRQGPFADRVRELARDTDVTAC